MPALRLAHLTDLHLDSKSAVALLRERIEFIIHQERPDAFVITGDIVERVPSDWHRIGPAYRRMWEYVQSTYGIAVFQCPGNHDIYNGDGTYDVSLYEAYCGPSNAVQTFKGFSIVSLNVLSGLTRAALKQRARDVRSYGCNEQWPGAATPSLAELKHHQHLNIFNFF